MEEYMFYYIYHIFIKSYLCPPNSLRPLVPDTNHLTQFNLKLKFLIFFHIIINKMYYIISI